MRPAKFFLALLLAFGLAAEAQAATLRIVSYDPANPQTRRLAGQLTFEFKQRLIFTEVVRVRSTTGAASAALKPAGEGELGVSLASLIGPNSGERDLYAIDQADEGKDMIRAFCPGAAHGWLVFGRLRRDEPLRVHVLGDQAGGGPARLCATLDFQFRGEWRLPRTSPVKPPPPVINPLTN